VSGNSKNERDSDTKPLPEEERYRQLMLRATEVSSSPEDLGSPLLEEKYVCAFPVNLLLDGKDSLRRTVFFYQGSLS
jgi:hypothetical protein